MLKINVTPHKRRKPYGGYTNVLSHERILKNCNGNVNSNNNFNIKRKITNDATEQWVTLRKSGITELEIKELLSCFYGKSIIDDLIIGLKKR